MLKCTTLVVPDVDAAADRFRMWLDYRPVETGMLDLDVAAMWGASALAGTRYVVMQPSSGASVYVRFVTGERPTHPPFRTLGWSAIEICVADVLAVNERMQRSPFTIIGKPEPMAAIATLHPMQVVGPDGELIFLTEIKPGAASGLPKAQSLIDAVFIAVHGAADVDRTLADFERIIGVAPRMDIKLRHGHINRAFGLPAETQHRLRTAQWDGRVCFELDQLPPGGIAPTRPSGGLRGGFAIATVVHPDLDRLPGPWLTPPRQRAGVVYGGGRAATLVGPEGALIEVVERRPGMPSSP